MMYIFDGTLKEKDKVKAKELARKATYFLRDSKGSTFLDWNQFKIDYDSDEYLCGLYVYIYLMFQPDLDADLLADTIAELNKELENCFDDGEAEIRAIEWDDFEGKYMGQQAIVVNARLHV